MKRWLLPIFMIVMLAIGTFGAYAYFWAPASATGNIKAGTLDLEVAGIAPSQDCNSGDLVWGEMTSLWTYQNLAPGDVKDGRLCMQNTGSIDIKQVGFAWSGVPLVLADNLFVTKLENSLTGDELASYVPVCDKNADAKMSLSELWGCGGTGEDEYWVGGVETFLPVGSIQWVEYAFEFNPLAGNDLQGAESDYTLIITGYQQKKY